MPGFEGKASLKRPLEIRKRPSLETHELLTARSLRLPYSGALAAISCRVVSFQNAGLNDQASPRVGFA